MYYMLIHIMSIIKSRLSIKNLQKHEESPVKNTLSIKDLLVLTLVLFWQRKLWNILYKTLQ